MVLRYDGSLQHAQFGHVAKTLDASGVTSFAVGAGGQIVYWLKTDNRLYQSINDGDGVYGGNWIASDVKSFALADHGLDVVVLRSDGSLQDPEEAPLWIALGKMFVFSVRPQSVQTISVRQPLDRKSVV